MFHLNLEKITWAPVTLEKPLVVHALVIPFSYLSLLAQIALSSLTYLSMLLISYDFLFCSLMCTILKHKSQYIILKSAYKCEMSSLSVLFSMKVKVLVATAHVLNVQLVRDAWATGPHRLSKQLLMIPCTEEVAG